jgi:SAM-dependent MidA family methyltransferase
MLSHLIAETIAETAQNRITFAEFMDLALYHPQHGYYANRALQMGVQGDFFTSPHLGPDFGELLAEQFVQMWEIMERPRPFTLVEMGAGQGLLAADVLGYLRRHFPEFCQGLQYVIVERAVPLIAAQQRQLQALVAAGLDIRWQSLAEFALDSIVGCCFSNELVDALPVHQVLIKAGHLQEIYVTTHEDSVQGDNGVQNGIQFVEILDQPSQTALTDYFKHINIDFQSPAYPEQYRTEVNLAALDWMGQVADRLHHGFVLTIDYGYTSDRYYSPTRSQGTLQCYYHHGHHSDPYSHVGEQDITAHVDFTALQQWGEVHQLTTLGFTQQGLFLIALGLGDRIAALSHSPATTPQAIHTTLRHREALHQLANPLGLGNFGVLIQSKGFAEIPQLKGLSILELGF